MKTDMASGGREEFSDSSHTRNLELNSGKSARKSRKSYSAAQVADAGREAETKLSGLDYLLTLLQSDLGEIRDIGGVVRLYDDPNGLIIQLPNVAICQNHKMMHSGQQCPMC